MAHQQIFSLSCFHPGYASYDHLPLKACDIHLKNSFASSLTLMNNLSNFDSSPMDIFSRSGMFAKKIRISYRFSEQKRRKEGI